MKLYDYQSDAIKRLKTGSILCGGVGSGKSITSLAYYYICCGGTVDPMTMIKKPTPLYIITTARKRDTHEWEKELANFGLSTDIDVSMCHTIVYIDSWNNIKKYKNVKNAFFIFDEQRVVGYGAWTKSFIEISRNNQWILLSATPGDCWMDYVPVFIANKFYKHKTDFITQHVIFSRSTKFPKVERYINTKYLERLRDSILVNMDYHHDIDIHKERVVLEYDRILYKWIMANRKNPFVESRNKTGEPIKDAGELCQVLRRVSNEMSPYKEQAFLDIYRRHGKLIVFYNFNYELEQMRRLLTEHSITFAEWNGHQHNDIPKGDQWVYLVQYTAGAEGWNCIRTNAMIFLSNNYSYKVMTQAAGRIDRMNTPYCELFYYYFVTNSKIDQAIERALKQKRNFSESKFCNF